MELVRRREFQHVIVKTARTAVPALFVNGKDFSFLNFSEREQLMVLGWVTGGVLRSFISLLLSATEQIERLNIHDRRRGVLRVHRVHERDTALHRALQRRSGGCVGTASPRSLLLLQE